MLKEDNKDSDVRYKNPFEYEKYIKKHYECMKADKYKVDVSERLYYRASKDVKVQQWLENSLAMLPYCMNSLNDMATVTGGYIVSCVCRLINYNNISTEICASDQLSELGQLCEKQISRSVIRTTSVNEIEEQVRYNSIFWAPEAESAGFKAKA